MAAPHITGLSGQPYQKQVLEQLFYPSYVAFSAAKKRSEEALCIIHTGNWGAGAFGNDPKAVALIQIAAAHLAGVDELRYYPMSSAAAFQEATQMFEGICTYFADSGNPMTVDAFLSHIEEKAKEFDLLYRIGNGT